MHNQRGFVGVGVLIVIILAVVVLGGGAYYVVHQQSSSPALSDNTLDNAQTLPTTNTRTQATTNTPAQTTPAQTQNSTPAATQSTSNLQTYTNSNYGFSVNYDPSVFKTYTSTMGKPDYTNTLLSLFYGAGSITFRGDKTTTYEDCLRNSTDTRNVTPIVIHGTTFYKSNSGDAGLGHSLSVDTYRTYYNGACYAIHTWIESDRTGDGSSYTDTTKEKKNLQNVLNTFKFNVPQIQPALHASAEPDWKTYTGSGMPISFTYPGNYVIQESADNGYGNEINITAGSKVGLDIIPGDSFTSAITIQKSLVTSNNTLQKNLDFDARNKQNYYQPITLGEVSGFFGGDINGPGLTNNAVINLQKGNYTYRILLYGPFPTSMYNNFVNSFKFTN